MPWVKGQSGNPNGRAPTNKLWETAIHRAIKLAEEENPKAIIMLANSLMKKARQGDVAALKEFGDRVDGKVPQAIVGSDEHPPVLALKDFYAWMKEANSQDISPENNSSHTINGHNDSQKLLPIDEPEKQ